MHKLNLKYVALTILKYSGIFYLCSLFFKNKLLILAYHGSEVADEASFNPNLFMRAATLQQRVDYLKGKKFSILSLADALSRLKNNSLPPKSVVLTFDDGWHSTGQVADKILSSYGFPYTIYVTSYYVETQQPVLNVLLRYAFFKTALTSISSSALGLDEEELFLLDNITDKNRCFNAALQKLAQFTERAERESYVLTVSAALDVDIAHVLKQRCFHLMSAQDLTDLARRGVDLQLHTHKHNVDLDRLETLSADIAQNKALIHQYAGYTPVHFCYPSGVHDSRTESILREANVVSATTCLPGFTYADTNPYYLPRFLDGENISQLLFEAEVCGVQELFRRTKQALFGQPR